MVDNPEPKRTFQLREQTVDRVAGKAARSALEPVEKKSGPVFTLSDQAKPATASPDSERVTTGETNAKGVLVELSREDPAIPRGQFPTVSELEANAFKHPNAIEHAQGCLRETSD